MTFRSRAWPLRKPDVDLRIARFLPEVAPAQPAKPIAGLAPLVRALFRDRRAKECEKKPDAYEYPDWRVEELARKYGGRDSDGR